MHPLHGYRSSETLERFMLRETARYKRKSSLLVAGLAAALVLLPTGYLVAKDNNKDKKKPSAKVVATTVAPMEEFKR
ncbi:MAG: hypothetical protein ABIP81_08420, partial [Terriglobales bacterium]